MATHDTDPQTTEPGAPPEEAEAAENAASLIADLAKAPLPAEDVRETEGHTAAAYAVAPHRPPRPIDKTVENPGVFVNATVPMPPPASPDSSRSALTVPGGRLLPTVASAHVKARETRTVLLASVGGAIAAALVALVVVLAFTRTRDGAAPGSSSASEAASAAPVPSPTPVPMMPPEPSTPATVASPPPTKPTAAPPATVRPRPAATAKPSAAPTFAQPDRTF